MAFSRVWRHGLWPVLYNREMLHELLLLTWSTLSLLMGAILYVELRKHDNFLYHDNHPLLSRFPLHHTQCCDNEYNSPISQGYTLESYDSGKDEFLSYRAFFHNYNVTLWRGENLDHLGPSAVKKIVFLCKIHHSSTINSSQSTVSTASNNDSMLTKNPTQSFAKCCDDKTTGYICENNILVNETHSNLAILNSFMNYNNPTLKPSRKSRINYPVATSRPRTTWIQWLLYGYASATLIGITVILHNIATQCLGCIISIAIGSETGVKNITISAETLQMFRHNFELVVKHKNIHFRRAQRYFKAGLRVNHQKNGLLAENRALRRELACLKAKCMNQRLYIEILEKTNINTYGNIHPMYQQKWPPLEYSAKSIDLVSGGTMDKSVCQGSESQSTLMEDSHSLDEEISWSVVKEEIWHQMCSNVSEITDEEKRLSHIFLPEAMPYTVKLPLPRNAQISNTTAISSSKSCNIINPKKSIYNARRIVCFPSGVKLKSASTTSIIFMDMD